MKIVVFHDVFSELALRPSWGAMFGKNAVSEQALARQSIERLPSNAVVLADRNFRHLFDGVRRNPEPA